MINEAALVKDLSNGNILAFNILYREYSVRVYRFALGYLKSEAEAEELVQEVFTKIWEKREHLNEELSFKSFLFTIAFNNIRKHFRTKAYLTDYCKHESVNNPDIQTSQKVIYDSLYQYITELIDQLPARRREILIKSRIDGFSIKEIAENLHISHKTVENQLSDALKSLRSKLNSENLPLVLFFALFLS
ncbi:MAG: RNA polymerase sigma-70 factor [Prolixibacteraceae bacterium]